MSDVPQVALGPVNTWTPLSGNLNTDNVIASIVEAAKGGQSTKDYFDQINFMNQLYEPLTSKGNDGWSDATDNSNIHAPMKVVSKVAPSGQRYYLQVHQHGMSQDEDGNMRATGDVRTINGVDYQGIGFIYQDCGYDNYSFSKTSWWVGTTIAGGLAAKKLMPYIAGLVKNVAKSLAENIKAVFLKLKKMASSDPEATQEAETTADGAGDTGITTDMAGEGLPAIIEGTTEEAAISMGTVFIGVGVALAIVFIALSFVLHNTYHSVRLWNLTGYKLTWKIHFDSKQDQDEGKLIHGPVVFNKNGSIKTYTPIPPAGKVALSPDAEPENACYYADMHINSSHETAGIGYVLQYNLTDPSTGDVVYTATMYFDLPWAGENSTGCTMAAVSSLQDYYDKNNGHNKKTSASATSDDGNITTTTTFDYLKGQHAVPDIPAGSSSNEKYYYQSVVNIQQKDLQPVFDAAPSAPHEHPFELAVKHAAENNTQGVEQYLSTLHPEMYGLMQAAFQNGVSE